MATVTETSWAQSLLQSMQLPTTDSNLRIIIGWEQAEGGAGPQFGHPTNIAAYNPLNTTQTMPKTGSTPASTDTPGNIPPVQAYSSWAQGLQATVITLNNGDYTAIIDALNTGHATPEVAAAAIRSSKWGTGKSHPLSWFVSIIYCVASVPGGLSIPAVKAGGAAGLGGTGTAANQTISSPFYVGDSTNPDQDYWTTINQYCQEAQWYTFSDGETLFVADGNLLMAQTPARVLHLFDPKIISLGFTWDNTSWSFAVTRRAKVGLQRRAALTRTTTPTAATLELICDIDDYRAGDVFYLLGTGPGDGLWLVGQTQRSIFQAYTTLTLSVGTMPLSAVSGESIGPLLAPSKTASKVGSGTVIAAMLSEATAIDKDNYQYVYGGGHARAGYPSVGSPGNGYNGVTKGFDCSGAVGAVLAAAGVGLTWGAEVPGDAGIISTLQDAGLLQPGQGPGGKPECVLFDNPGVHIYMRLNGTYWGTEAGGQLPSNHYGVGWVYDGGPQAGFTAYHIPAKTLRGYITGSNANSGTGGGA
jgi:hypothetical protein